MFGWFDQNSWYINVGKTFFRNILHSVVVSTTKLNVKMKWNAEKII